MMNWPAAVLLASALFLAAPVFAASDSDLHIAPNGRLSAENVVVQQKSGANLFCRAIWGSAFVRIVVLTAPGGVAAPIAKNHGEAATIDDVREGDILNVEGMLTTAADSLVINAIKITDLSLNRETKKVSGTVRTPDYGSSSFVLTDKIFGAVTVVAAPGTAITKGVRSIVFGDIAAGDKVTAASGTYDYASKTLNASAVEVYQDKSIFVAQNFAGTLKSIAGTALPASVVVTVGKTNYTVYLGTSARVYSKNYVAVGLSRYASGDSVRFYGSKRQTNFEEVDATVIRNLAF